MPYRAVWEPAQGGSEPTDSFLDGMLKALDDHETTTLEVREQRQSRREFIQHWLDALKNWERELATEGLQYSRVEESGGYFTFTLSNSPPDNLDWADDTPMAIARVDGEYLTTVPVGDLVDRRGRQVRTSRPNRRLRRTDIPDSGRLLVDPVQERSSNRRQTQASYSFISGEVVNPKVADAVVDPKTATRMPEPSLDFYQDWLSDDKKDAVRRAVSSNEIFLIQGPPGTGKTAVIAEIVLQILKRDPDARILLSSQSNVAVNHALAQVANAAGDQIPEMIRLGRDERIGDDGKNWAIQQRADSMRQEVVDKCDEVIDELRRAERAARSATTNSGSESGKVRQWIDDARSAIADLPASEPQVRDRLGSLADSLGLPISYNGANAQEVLDAAIEAVSAQYGFDSDSQDSDAPKPARFRKTRDIVEEWRGIVGLTPDFAKLIVEQSNVVGATCLYSGGSRMPEADFDWAIIDEAGRATLPETLVPMAKAERAILVGDEEQLPPMIEEAAANVDSPHASEDNPLDKSLFQSLVEDMPPQHLAALQTQYRMHPAIGNLISEVFYEGNIAQGATTAQRPNYDWMARPVTWLSTSSAANKGETRRGSSFANHVEADLVLDKLEELEERCREGGWQPTVGVISGYSAQVDQLRRAVDPNNQRQWRQIQIEIATVDAFQGRECDIVIYSTVRSNRNRRIGFLKDHRRVNVALSRARDSLVIVGDEVMMRNASLGMEDNPFSAVLDHMMAHRDDCAIVPYAAK